MDILKVYTFVNQAGNRVEFATLTPGFTLDEPLEHLGETLALPPFLEPKRTAIEANLYKDM